MANLSLPCSAIDVGPDEIIVTLPGGITFTLAFPGAGIPSSLAATKQLIAQINASLAPAMPLFRVVDCLLSVPDVVTDPTGFLDKLSNLAALFPPANIPRIALSVVDVMLAYLNGVKSQITTFIAQEARLLDAATKASRIGGRGGLRLQAHVDCATGQLTLQIDSMNNGMAPLSALASLLNALLHMVPGAPTVPTFASLGPDLAAMLTPLQEVIDGLQVVRTALAALVH